METWKYDIYVVYPGAIAKVLNADIFIAEETNLPHADWAFLTLDDERIDIMMTRSLWRSPRIYWGFSTRNRVYMCLALKCMTIIAKKISFI